MISKTNFKERWKNIPLINIIAIKNPKFTKSIIICTLISMCILSISFTQTYFEITKIQTINFVSPFIEEIFKFIAIFIGIPFSYTFAFAIFESIFYINDIGSSIILLRILTIFLHFALLEVQIEIIKHLPKKYCFIAPLFSTIIHSLYNVSCS